MTFDRRALLTAGLALPFASAAAREAWTRPAGLKPDASIALWPEGHIRPPAGLVEAVVQRSDDPKASDRMLQGITHPRLDIFRPAKPNGAAVILAPGGGYRYVVVDKEGYELARWLRERGVTVYVLFYRLPADGWTNGADVPLADAQRAVRLVRSRAGADGIDPARIAFGGFSAGGQVATSLLTRFGAQVYARVDAADALSARPDALAAIYPVVSMDPAIAHAVSREKLIGANPDTAREKLYSPERNVRANQPPLWLLHAEDDSVVKVENSVRLREATRAVGAPVEAHFFERGEHGFGLMKAAGLPIAIWPELLWNWLASHKIV
ncbi:MULTISPECIES: alpha/beta hydrolase [unclassified Sphingopyxis]|uniref:alpha/beta hydrolase n=1 Tax=unclassified Sphingopyxis TaxID=2614943 RepID=UPI00285FBF19|nr:MULTISPECIES: alpha/beta hydrolase [unclassified Sphingopyxis]MDR7061418.1 acetyl esterase/lipase [Sphingopyxis sp. BE235]MDR7181851.1 acetyl esterase/lipase [Sphingopyxis sp. BE249]